VGTGTFLHSVIDYIYESFRQQKGMWSSYVSKHLLPRLFGFELLMAPYTVAHMKLGLQLQELGYDFSADERLGIYLTNTLQEAFQIPPADGFLNRICDEAESAQGVKQEHPVMVIIGNPPYSGHSVNTGEWIKELLKGKDIISGEKTASYFEVDSQPLGEKNPKWLNDDYVKFIRFSQWRIEKTGYGILAFVTNHGYLDNPTFRGMRQSLLKTFDDIYILDLHGNSKKKKSVPMVQPIKMCLIFSKV
jgi:predicted helicase